MIPWLGRNTPVAAFALLVALAPYAVAAAEQSEDPLLATVNGEEIHKSDAMRALGRIPPQMRQLPEEQLLPSLVNIMIDTRLLADKAEKEGLPDDPEVAAQLNFARNVVLEQMLLNRYLEEHINEETLRERYDELVKNTADREQVHARHILVEDEETAKEVIAKLDEGADFAELAEEMSTGPSGGSGGDLGYFSRDDMIPAFADAAFALEPGSYTKTPVKTEFGWHVIKVEDRKTADPPSFEQVEDQLRQEVARELRAKYVEGLRADAEIEKFGEALGTAGREGDNGGKAETEDSGGASNDSDDSGAGESSKSQ